MDIHPFGPDDAAEVAAWAELANAVAAADAPWSYPTTPTLVRGRLAHGWDGEPESPYLVRVAGTAVAAGSISTSDYDNLDLAVLHVEVHPGHRRRGHGTALLEVLLDEARRRRRTSLVAECWDAEPGDAFARQHGFVRKLAAINRRQYLADVDRPTLTQQYDAALPHARDYVLERWPVPTPDDRLDDLAVMASAINDAPLDDLDYEDEVFTADRMRAYEVATAGRGERMYRLVARHRATGVLAAQTVVAVETADPRRAHQHDTSVTRAHRGHRLGLVLKTEMLPWLAEAEPALETVETWNAESNDHMIGVNEVLGYRVLGREWAYQRAL
ncbi:MULTISPECIES: GNAT family N-acetyltransferase [unclassified Nocardioides]|uniref:GNAT family N-acetyltransferase n=1 Tax=unclassified Nocardioides TaxID=2615069 RepID=UPI0007028875|nr:MULTISPECIES: GNAT family N-acetyltransferase [unclassified Nocardioides]KRC50034.1 hypothetical protein ASE19_15550 [Nocardioides sp. Root79]KRC75502.1 hypothetical protein ASE20_21570 [Nocardioides sp. Root240]